MTDSSRRSLLCGTAGLLALTAGCIADNLGGPSGADDNETEDDDETDDTEADAEETEDDETKETETRAFRHGEPATEPNAALFLEREDAEEWLEERRIDDSEDAVAEFVDETSFEESSLTALEAGAPNLCYELLLESATVEDGRLDLEAVVSDEESDEMGCAQQETTVGVLVCASDGGEPVTDVSATVVDREGSEHEFELDPDSDSNTDEGSGSDSTSDDDNGEEETENDSDDE